MSHKLWTALLMVSASCTAVAAIESKQIVQTWDCQFTDMDAQVQIISQYRDDQTGTTDATFYFELPDGQATLAFTAESTWSISGDTLTEAMTSYQVTHQSELAEAIVPYIKTQFDSDLNKPLPSLILQLDERKFVTEYDGMTTECIPAISSS